MFFSNIINLHFRTETEIEIEKRKLKIKERDSVIPIKYTVFKKSLIEIKGQLKNFYQIIK
jgi:hypothetical protein